ncbi:hypothetical protein CVS30_10005 [Arthrobacter psychrolactophilus]|uniref:Uncharacterized protein n=1 Tax=Arthrobacter psychrolactophilus TaxID=92442 RepID=A0A2V5IW61_9MICC|nr:hypothetical protein [Arthrobacter psychrolactophilus]PYI38453.1 hypothetical protein CVS30_10005 [Arthrobacter psychrolactophilus]
MWNHILQEQIIVGGDEFWSCVAGGVLPVRGTTPVPESELPLALVWQLTHTAGIDEGGVAGMTREQAVQAINDYWMSQGKTRPLTDRSSRQYGLV